MYKQFYIILLLSALSGVMFGVYMQRFKDHPTWKAHIIQWVSIFGLMITSALWGIHSEHYTHDLHVEHTIFWFVFWYYPSVPYVFWGFYNIGRMLFVKSSIIDKTEYLLQEKDGISWWTIGEPDRRLKDAIQYKKDADEVMPDKLHRILKRRTITEIIA